METVAMFEVGKKYIDADNKTVYECLCVHGSEGWLKNLRTKSPTTWTYNPVVFKEYKEPIKVSGWMNYYSNGTVGGVLYETKQAAFEGRNKQLYLTTIYVSGEEGKEPCSKE